MSAFVAKLGSLFTIALCGWIGWLVGSKRSELVAEPTGNRSAPHRSVNGASDALPAEDFQELLDSAPVEAFPEILAAISNLPNYQRRHIRPIAVETWARLDPAAAFAFAQAREDDWDSYAMKARIVEQWGPSGMEVINRLVEQEGIRPNLALSAIERCAKATRSGSGGSA